jgi:hypothetical protein
MRAQDDAVLVLGRGTLQSATRRAPLAARGMWVRCIDSGSGQALSGSRWQRGTSV